MARLHVVDGIDEDEVTWDHQQQQHSRCPGVHGCNPHTHSQHATTTTKAHPKHTIEPVVTYGVFALEFYLKITIIAPSYPSNYHQEIFLALLLGQNKILMFCLI